MAFNPDGKEKQSHFRDFLARQQEYKLVNKPNALLKIKNNNVFLPYEHTISRAHTSTKNRRLH